MDSKTSSNFNSLRLKAHSIVQSIVQINSFLDKVKTDKSLLCVLKAMLPNLESLFSDFNDTHLKMIECFAKSEMEPTQEVNDLKLSVNTMYYTIKGESANLFPSVEAKSSDYKCNVYSNPLPSINLPEFNGDPLKFREFKDLYLSIVDSDVRLTPSMKFNYLKGCLKDKAFSLISHLDITDSNYPIAWQLLLDSYDSSFTVASEILNKMLLFTPITSDNPQNLDKFLQTFSCLGLSFTKMNIPNPSEFILFHIAFRALDSGTKKQFLLEHTDVEFPTLSLLVEYIKKCRKAVCDNSTKYVHNVKQNVSNKQSKFSSNKVSLVASDVQLSCQYCAEQHKINQCSKFKSLSSFQRNNFIKSKKFCFNCMSPQHRVTDCVSNSRCHNCNGKHHTLLCFKSKPSQSVSNTNQSNVSLVSSKPITVSTKVVSCSAQSVVPSSSSTVVLGTAIVYVRGKNNSLHRFRTLIDPCSQASYITARCVQVLGLKKVPVNVSSFGLGAVASQKPSGCIDLTIQPEESSTSFKAQAFVIPQITLNQPLVNLPSSIRDKYKDLKLADPNFHVSSEIHMLLGAEVYNSIVTGEKIIFPPGFPCAWNTIFGYILLGPCLIQDINSNPSSQTSLVCVQSNLEVNNLLQKFWELEEIPTNSSDKLSPDEVLAEEMFTNLHYREESGKYVVPLLVKPGEVEKLGSSFDIANRRLNFLKKKFVKNSKLKFDYCDFMQEYEELSHMTKVPLHSGSYYLPHHPVLRTDTRGLKLRVVFDASSPTSSGRSLNSVLLKGPKLQKPIEHVLTRFRLSPIAIVCDIKHNFRMIKILPCDRKFLHILWSPDDVTPLSEFELETVTYGTASAPYLALRTTEQVRIDEGHKYPLANKVLLRQILVDDIMGGAKDLEEARQLISELIQIMSNCGFTLHKWATNVQTNLFDNSSSPINLDIENSSTIKVLGLQWSPVSDQFCYTVNHSSSANTKRQVLSSIARVFDPLGWISPVTIWAKQFLQRLWRLGLDWDTILPEQELIEWQEFVSAFDCLSDFRVPRVMLPSDSTECSLIGFCDASEKSYAAVVYLRSNSLRFSGTSQLVMAKTKVAPVKPLTIPRLELLGAVHLMKLVNNVHESLCDSVKISDVILFTDSSIVLCWLKTEPYKLQTFVCHRVVTILNSTVPLSWKHVPSKDNPADIASKGCLPAQLLQHPLWLNGPHWITLPNHEWPSFSEDKPVEVPELKVTLQVTSTQAVDMEEYFANCSSFIKLQKSIAYWLRYMHNLKEVTKKKGPLLLNELQRATSVIVKVTQQKYFKQDIKAIEVGKQCTSQLKSLNPFLSPLGILVVGGRLQNSNLGFYAQHPMILPKSSVVTQLLIKHYHHLFLHVGVNTLNYLLRTKFWIVSSRNAIRRVLRFCHVCRKFNANPSVPLMGNLPIPRVNFVRPFLHCGVDLAGPFLVKESTRRNAKINKAYLCIFVCLAVKAVHLEVISALSTDAFLAAFDRFTSRRGLCSDIYSDEGRNFVGANRALREAYRLMFPQDVIMTAMCQRSVTWHFNPPFAPNFGGIWEANIRSAKTHLKKIIGNRVLTFEELTTVFCRIEAVMNSRPLIEVPVTISDAPAICPSHFLVGSVLLNPPESSLLEEKPDLLKRWKLVSQIRQHFAQRWTRDYLNTLQQRRKFQADPVNLKTDDLVWIKGSNNPTGDWPLGRVVEVFPGSDNRVRVAKIKTCHGEYTRPVSKLVKLSV